jgi:hypothetical protein
MSATRQNDRLLTLALEAVYADAAHDDGDPPVDEELLNLMVYDQAP